MINHDQWGGITVMEGRMAGIVVLIFSSSISKKWSRFHRCLSCPMGALATGDDVQRPWMPS